MKLAAVVVTYYPDINDTIKNIRRYINYVDKLIIWENTPIKDREQYKIVIPELSNKIIYLGTEKNEGIAYALNRCIEWSIQYGYTHILTMDQDSYFENFDTFKNEVSEIEDKIIGIFAPNVNHTYSDLDIIEPKDGAITSGSIFPLWIFQSIGFFREDYFIDAVDFEFCLRAKKNGFKTVICGNSHLKQSYGNPIDCNFFNRSLTNYSAFRTFFIVRNHIWMWREYSSLLSIDYKKYIIMQYILKRFLVILLIEENKYKKIYSILKGCINGVFLRKC